MSDAAISASGQSQTAIEVASQPDVWEWALAEHDGATGLPAAGERVAVVGCGTSWFMAQSYAAQRESAGHGVTDAFTASEFPAERSYDRLVAISRSGTTTEIVHLLQRTDTPSVLLTAVGEGPAAAHADHEIVLDRADETSVVQTRFATTALVVLRASLGEDLTAAVADARTALTQPIEDAWVSADQLSFLGTGWTIGLAHEAALKLRESSQSWTESYPAMEYRHGPISIAQPGRVVWVFGTAPDGLAGDVQETGATLAVSELDPLAHLVLLHRVAVARSEARGLNPDTPRHLSRAVILDTSD
ncbi:SIS domain-containing protein [Ruania alba]|uniref:Fructoselysine-6-P-deglycase FrlB with duplicated sugar isomerase (SIS) domain n=1 Tax=Ruania alba TaxID=648782 RepID=A0A1H5EPG7_9MICO|nr:SIS domain-containing protein [Ruania alba]SED93083.1 Fructoselysine-6-P-deglycase FrlB with duplicated sugar isomerase (SIS) domain [Ruania alba]